MKNLKLIEYCDYTLQQTKAIDQQLASHTIDLKLAWSRNRTLANLLRALENAIILNKLKRV